MLYHGKVTADGERYIGVPEGTEVVFTLQKEGHPFRGVNASRVYSTSGRYIAGIVSFVGADRGIDPVEDLSKQLMGIG